jgi:hypothetical protein
VRRRYLIVVPRPMSAAPSRYLIAVPKPLPAASLVVCLRYLIVVPRPFPAAPLFACRRYLILVPGPAAPRRSFQFAKAGSAATLPKHEKSKSVDV